ncbi:hypothetical protein GCM10028796_18770 [Ramlibacter monticola]|uniref:Uncharacterized protein n=1 Tax=Ramlibacter monticola TaxID=1926872 RepID=A0A936YZ70_9BURK|nr:hypothetical protein [Ramlibacter monticola]MBL0392138.1 hypothetical protein [Ramlibacter monticola]
MYFLVLFAGVMFLLFFLAWKLPLPAGFAFEPLLPARAPGQGTAPASFAARFFGSHKEDEPCLTPVDCVQKGRCAGHCGWH